MGSFHASAPICHIRSIDLHACIRQAGRRDLGSFCTTPQRRTTFVREVFVYPQISAVVYNG